MTSKTGFQHYSGTEDVFEVNQRPSEASNVSQGYFVDRWSELFHSERRDLTFAQRPGYWDRGRMIATGVRTTVYSAQLHDGVIAQPVFTTEAFEQLALDSLLHKMVRMATQEIALFMLSEALEFSINISLWFDPESSRGRHNLMITARIAGQNYESILDIWDGASDRIASVFQTIREQEPSMVEDINAKEKYIGLVMDSVIYV